MALPYNNLGSPPPLPNKAKKPTAKPAHPPYRIMIPAAIASLNRRNGSSIYAISKYIMATYMKLAKLTMIAVRIKRVIRELVEIGDLVQVKRSFKLSKEEKPAAAKGATK